MLKRLQPYHFEIVIVDTGSNDNTVMIAQKYTDKIFHFEWCDDFSAARNFAITHATNNWIWFIDCDEYLSHINLKDLKTFISNKNENLLGFITIKNMFDSGSSKELQVDRIFHKNSYLYRGKVNEQLTSIHKLPTIVYPLLITCEHYGYVNHTIVDIKFHRQSTLLFYQL